jgi:glycerol kinase
MGATFLAGMATGVWATKEEAAAAWSLDRRFAPEDTERAEANHSRWRRAVERARDWERRT